MAPELHQRVRQIFDQALECPEAKRKAFVEKASAGDATIQEAVERLLAARVEADAFLESTVQNTGQIGRYLVRRELGRGAMGIVYDAVDPMIGRRVAVKVINLKGGMEPSQAEFMKERLFREAKSAGRLFHPGIVVILDVGLHGDAAFITMEHVDGRSLQQLLASGGALAPQAALSIIKQTASALDYAHRLGVVHRDIKPANIMLHGDITVKVADFGIAKLMSTQNATVTGMLMGTPSYMSPEQIEARPVDGRSDQFSLGVLAYELLTGVRPFEADSMPTLAHLIVYGPRPSAHAAKTELPPGIDQVVTRALSRFPEERFGSCTEFADALEKVLEPSTLATQELTVIEQPKPAAVIKKRSPRSFLYIGGVAALFIAALVLASGYYKHLPPQQPTVKAAAPLVTPPPVSPEAKPKAPPFLTLPAPAPIAPKVEPEVVPSTPKSKTISAALRAQQLVDNAMKKRMEGKPQEAVALFRQAAELGNASAMEELAECYSTGEGVAKDPLEQMRWLTRAEAAGNVQAMLDLGGLYFSGSDIVAQSDEQAAHWWQMAADRNDPAGMYDLAGLYEEGKGVPRDMEKAKQLYRESAARGHYGAIRRLSELDGQK